LSTTVGNKVDRSRVRETTKLPRTLDRSRVSSLRRTSSDRYCGLMGATPSTWNFGPNWPC